MSSATIVLVASKTLFFRNSASNVSGIFLKLSLLSVSDPVCISLRLLSWIMLNQLTECR
jgi:hypothetical protein